MKKSLLSLAVATALGVASASASAANDFLDFKVNESSVPDSTGGIKTADKMNGSYTEVLTITSPTTFTATAYANFSALLKNDGATPVASQINCGIDPFCYNIYAIFTASGTYSGSNFTGTSGSFDLYIDAKQDTVITLGVNALLPVGLTGDGEDYKIASSSNMTFATGFLNNPGAYELHWNDFTLTPEGEAYFIDPRPFYMNIVVDGDFDQINFDTPNSTFDVTGDVSAVFVVPEPATLALMGLGLVGLAARRRKSA